MRLDVFFYFFIFYLTGKNSRFLFSWCGRKRNKKACSLRSPAVLGLQQIALLITVSEVDHFWNNTLPMRKVLPTKKKRKQGNRTPHVIHNLFPFPRNIGVYSNSSCRSVNSGSNTIAVCQEVWSLIKKRKKRGGKKKKKKRKSLYMSIEM